MSNYQESQVAGTKWLRASRLVVENPYQGTPSAMFVEQQAMQLGDEVILKDVANLSIAFTPNAVIPLINPETGESLGTSISHQDLYIILHSLYIQAAQIRDGAV